MDRRNPRTSACWPTTVFHRLLVLIFRLVAILGGHHDHEAGVAVEDMVGADAAEDVVREAMIDA